MSILTINGRTKPLLDSHRQELDEHVAWPHFREPDALQPKDRRRAVLAVSERIGCEVSRKRRGSSKGSLVNE